MNILRMAIGTSRCLALVDILEHVLVAVWSASQLYGSPLDAFVRTTPVVAYVTQQSNTSESQNDDVSSPAVDARSCNEVVYFIKTSFIFFVIQCFTFWLVCLW